MRLAAVLIILGIALMAFGTLNPDFGKTFYPAGSTFSLSEMDRGGLYVSELSIYAGAAMTALGVLLGVIRFVRR